MAASLNGNTCEGRKRTEFGFRAIYLNIGLVMSCCVTQGSDQSALSLSFYFFLIGEMGGITLTSQTSGEV